MNTFSLGTMAYISWLVAGCSGIGDETIAREDIRGVASLTGCGDGILDPGEACDDGNTTDHDGCSAACPLCGSDDWSWAYTGT